MRQITHENIIKTIKVLTKKTIKIKKVILNNFGSYMFEFSYNNKSCSIDLDTFMEYKVQTNNEMVCLDQLVDLSNIIAKELNVL